MCDKVPSHLPHFLLSRKDGIGPFLFALRGNQVQASLMNEAPVGEPCELTVGDEMGAAWSHRHTVQYLSLGGGGQHICSFHDLEVFVEGPHDPSSFHWRKELTSERDRRSSVRKRPSHLLAPGSLSCASPSID
ncbi:uncharacterized protein TNCV_4954901 [Trichonephila clavipes]|nr:uncharacterized protein TNCV_4954901 [Trichonephila clavipes]